MIFIAKRNKVFAKKDRKTFSETASKSKVINLSASVFRGGVRL